jgi:glycerol-3-phosphate dehydrogenase
MDRDSNIQILKQSKKTWDLAVIGGGASGLGIALDALSRGLTVALFEKADFAKGTSSRSTKLLHGGVRYLAQGNIRLVIEALRERGKLLKNAPHLTINQSFIIPLYSWKDFWMYRIGLKVYDGLAANLSLGKSVFIKKEEVLNRLPHIQTKGLLGGVVYHDGQFDDARLALAVAQTCDQLKGCLLNYFKVTRLLKNKKGKVSGLKVKDVLSNTNYEVKAKMVVNATGVFADKILRMDNPKAAKTIIPSQGIHLVVDAHFLGGNDALMIPKTSDGRVLFAVPWQNKVVFGTTDTLIKKPLLEPKALKSEIEFVLKTAATYLAHPPQKSDVKSVFVGLRPLAAPQEGSSKTKEISRSHKIIVSESNLVSLVGGKWTTFRKMGEDTVDYFFKLTGEKFKKSTSGDLKLYGHTLTPSKGHLSVYGKQAKKIKDLMKDNPQMAEVLHPRYPFTFAEVQWAVLQEMAVTLEDVLARRIRILFLDAQAALEMAPRVAECMANLLHQDESWIIQELSTFEQLAHQYLIALSDSTTN